MCMNGRFIKIFRKLVRINCSELFMAYRFIEIMPAKQTNKKRGAENQLLSSYGR